MNQKRAIRFVSRKNRWRFKLCYKYWPT